MTTLRVNVKLLRGQIAIGQQEDQGVIPLDRPKEAGGTGLGFNGGHLMLLGWGACFKANLVAAAEARSLELHTLEIEIAGETAKTPNRFSSFRMSVKLEGDFEREIAEKLVVIARNSCIASNTLELAASVEIELI